ncbi:MAG: hypothetical protein QNJ30_26555 [Kiloniellales bacterium]|nr:hypothetical protein [Kiloniellales bacterium]
MRAKHVAYILVFVLGLICGNSALLWSQHGALAQNQSPEEQTLRDTSYEEAELNLLEAQLAFANKANKTFGGGVYSPILIKLLENKRNVLRTFLAEQSKAEPDIQAVLVEKAEGRLEVARLELDLEMNKEMRALHELNIRVAEERVKRVKSDQMRDRDYRQSWLIGQLELDMMGMRLDLELAR